MKYFYTIALLFCPVLIFGQPYISLGCPDDNHPHALDLGLPSGVKRNGLVVMLEPISRVTTASILPGERLSQGLSFIMTTTNSMILRGLQYISSLAIILLLPNMMRQQNYGVVPGVFLQMRNVRNL